jgi:hypothetical protein
MKIPPYPRWGIVVGIAAAIAVNLTGYALGQHFHTVVFPALAFGVGGFTFHRVAGMSCFKPPGQGDR